MAGNWAIRRIFMKPFFRKAGPSDTEVLRRLAYSSEGYWGYDTRFMDTFNAVFNITSDFICRYPVYIGLGPCGAVCFWGIIPDGDCAELEYFYIDRSCLKNGYGRAMWGHLTGWCRQHHIHTLSFVTSPMAVGFYTKMGAAQSGTRKSSIDRRDIPFLTFHP